MPPHILVAEDSPLITGALRVLFEETGYRVTIAETVAGAVAAGVHAPVDLMLLDLSLPDGDGLSTLAGLSEHGATPRHTVALTGHGDDGTRTRCLEAGCVDVWVKPVPVAELLHRVRRLLDD